MIDEKDYLRVILCPIIKHPEDLKIEKTKDEQGILLTVEVNAADMGLVIGKGGEIAITVRRLLRQYGFLNQKRISMKVIEPRQ
jgi:predicted RNA-binding protein YlqC (UPF0109 family)